MNQTEQFDSLYKLNFLTMILYILYKTDNGCSTVLHLHLLTVEEQEETGKHKHTSELPHVFAHAF